MNKYFLLIGCVMLTCSFVTAQKGTPPKKPTEATVVTNFPQDDKFSLEKMERLKVENGFTLDAAANGLGKPRMLAVDDLGRLYVTRRDKGDVLLLTDKNGDGKFDETKTVVSNFEGVHGIAIHDKYLYLISNRELRRSLIEPDGSIDSFETLITDLPDGGQHGNRTIAFGPDNMLYITIGSTCNDCKETNKESATIVRANPDGTGRKVFAKGLRNTIGIDWHPTTGELWGADNGTDWRGDNIPPEEINQISEGKDYGWPLVYGKQKVDETRENPVGSTKEQYAKTTEASFVDLPAHSAPINMVFLDEVKNLPEDMRDDAIVTLHGSWNKKQPDGYKIVRIVFEKGKAIMSDNFLSGFLAADGKTKFGRPAGLAISKDGRIYISDDANGVIYMMTYGENGAAKK